MHLLLLISLSAPLQSSELPNLNLDQLDYISEILFYQYFCLHLPHTYLLHTIFYAVAIEYHECYYIVSYFLPEADQKINFVAAITCSPPLPKAYTAGHMALIDVPDSCLSVVQVARQGQIAYFIALIHIFIDF